MCLSSCVWYVHYLYFFFFKQKTAYEMRISDWSSDVCSSDLGEPRSSRAGRPVQACQRPPVAHRAKPGARNRELGRRGKVFPLRCLSLGDGAGAFSRVAPLPFEGRSEEHTSELQSLMRISYAVFCLKKKNSKHKYKFISNNLD